MQLEELISNQFPLPSRVKTAILALAQFVALIYASYFLQTFLTISAPRLDRQLWYIAVAGLVIVPGLISTTVTTLQDSLG